MKEFCLKTNNGMQQNYENENQQNNVSLDKIQDSSLVSGQREIENIRADCSQEELNEMEQDQMIQYDLMQIESQA